MPDGGGTEARGPRVARDGGSDPPSVSLNHPEGDDVEGTEPESAEEAFEAFLEERYPKLVATVRVIVRDHDTAEDLVQEAFARAYLSWSKLWPEGNPGGWIHRVATNLAISWRRRAAREVRAITRLGRQKDLSHPAPEAYPELHRAVAGLPVRQRTAVSLYYVLGLPVAEVAEAMDCRPGTVKSLLFQARERLREELGGEDG